MADNWETIREYVAGEDRAVAPIDAAIPPQRALVALRQSQANLAAVAEAPTPSPNASPPDFAIAIQAREAGVRKKDAEGQDIPRKYESVSWIKPLYQAHDTLVSLPRPGGIGALVAILVLFFFILIPATSAGETRALLLWDVLLGKKQVYDPTAPQLVAIDAGSGAATLAAQQQDTSGVYYNILGQQIQPPGVG